MKRTSPPVPVTARPVATPGTAVRIAASWKNFWRPRASRTRSSVDRHGRLHAVPDAICVAVLRSTVPSSRSRLRTPASRVYSVTTVRSDAVVDRHLVLAQAVALALARPQVALGDGDLLLDGVAVEADDLHAVQQRPGDRLGHVGRGDEHDLGEVELDVEVVVAERVVLRGVEDLEQRRDGSPRQSAPTLSTSSSMITGFIVPASRRARTSRPGSAPMYVRRWPRISASSRTPPSDMRTNSRPVARAIDSPIEVLPVPGGPIRVRIAPERLSSLRSPRSVAQLLARRCTRRCGP